MLPMKVCEKSSSEPSQCNQKHMVVSGAKWVPSYKTGEVVFSVPASEFEKLLPPLGRR